MNKLLDKRLLLYSLHYEHQFCIWHWDLKIELNLRF